MNYMLDSLKHSFVSIMVQDRGEKTKYQHHYYDDHTIENLARYFKVNKDPEILILLKNLRKDGY